MLVDEQSVRDVVSRWLEASRAGDTETVLSLMTDDVVFMVPGREPFGREAFEAGSKAQGEMRIEGTSEILELEVIGNWAFTRNRIELVISRAGNPPVERNGYTLTLFRKGADGHWRLARDANLVT